jgi:DNA polymerase (family 10)
VVTDQQFPYALAYFTGSKEHNVAIRGSAQKQGLKVNEYGITKGSTLIEVKDEVEFYKALGLAYVPPEMRENTGNLTLRKFRNSLNTNHLKEFSTLIPHGATGRPNRGHGREGPLDGAPLHGPLGSQQAAAYANGLDEARLAEAVEGNRQAQQEVVGLSDPEGPGVRHPPSGDLDLSPEALGKLDFVIGSSTPASTCPRRR